MVANYVTLYYFKNVYLYFKHSVYLQFRNHCFGTVHFGKPVLTILTSIQIEPKDVVKNWMRLKNTLEYPGFWEQLNNPSFKGVEFDPLLRDAGNT